MAPRQNRTDAGRHPTPPEHTPRLRLKPKAPHTGYVDGAWWPRSDDLTTELPDLLAVLSVRLGPIDRVLYKLNDWAKAPTELATGGHAVRLERIPTPATKHCRSARTRPQQDRSAGSPAPHRPGPRTCHLDGRSGARRRLDRRWLTHDQPARQGIPHTESCRARTLGLWKRSRAIARRCRRPRDQRPLVERPASYTAGGHNLRS